MKLDGAVRALSVKNNANMKHNETLPPKVHIQYSPNITIQSSAAEKNQSMESLIKKALKENLADLKQLVVDVINDQNARKERLSNA